jgi:hypothetical protein
MFVLQFSFMAVGAADVVSCENNLTQGPKDCGAKAARSAGQRKSGVNMLFHQWRRVVVHGQLL